MKEINKIHLETLKTMGIIPDPERPFVWKVGDKYITATQLKTMMECQEEREEEFTNQ